MSNNTYEAALRYAKFDASDPFTFSRIMSHYENGVAPISRDENGRYAYDVEIEVNKQEKLEFKNVIRL